MKKLIWILIGQLIAACGFNLVLSANHLVATGFGGIAMVLNHIWGINVQLVLILLCIPVFVWSFLSYDRKQVFYAAFSYGMFTFYIGFVDKIFQEFVTDPIVATITGGVMLGIAQGIILKQAVANGPESIVGIYLKDKKGITVGTFFMAMNTLIISSSILFQDVTLIIYSLICNFICSKVTDIVIIGTEKYYIVRIMSDNYLDITGFISKELTRGVTFIQGMDTSNVKKKMLIETVVSKRELIRLKEYIKSINDDSFVYVTESAGLIGKEYRE
ncbi:YitT family protein [Konateibacter massiliensis]|uniref:YitT family protein n=1 Tax=Konateibacter massiliensis TaxID=2002841 RepID=UPI001F3098C2|nr:YitT family protein [Konateibacter massiliensis]